MRMVKIIPWYTVLVVNSYAAINLRLHLTQNVRSIVQSTIIVLGT